VEGQINGSVFSGSVQKLPVGFGCAYLYFMHIPIYLKKASDEIRLRGYSDKTLKSYTACLRDYLESVPHAINWANERAIKSYLLAKHDQGYSSQTVNLYLNAIKFFYRYVVMRKFPSGIAFAKKTQKIPVVFEHAEIIILLRNIKNLKHQLMISLAYGAGLRVSELVSLKLRDIDFNSKTIRITRGKGGKQRNTLLPEKLIVHLKRYCLGKSYGDLVFESERGGKMTTRTAQMIFARALKRSGIAKPASLHSLRHSFATHLLQSGVSIRYVQELLGHSSIKTTQLYTKVHAADLVSIKSPL
jgi:site-specific recombinase XerD